MRAVAKAVNYSLVNGRTSQGLAQELNIPEPEAKRIMNQNLAQFPRVQEYQLETTARAREFGHVCTLTGRRRYLPDIQSSRFILRKMAERAAVSSRIQGSAADLIKLAMIRIHAELKRRRLQTQLLLSVHDELVFDLWIPEQAEVVALIQKEMCHALPLAVPLEVRIGVGANWLEAH